MNRGFVGLALAAAVLAGCSRTAPAPGATVPVASVPGQVANLTPAEVQQRLAAGEEWVVLDVREDWEFREGHIPGARLIPLGSLANRTGELDKQARIVVVCRSGNRSAQGAELLASAGFRSVYNMSGGMLQWQGKVEK